MKSHRIAVLALLAFAFLVSGVAYADAVEGKVVSVDLEGQAIEIAKTDAATGATENVRVSVSDTTAYSGEVTALAEVIEGDTIKVEADKDAASGNWVAKSVDISAAVE